jgi:hypothetical protein
LAHEAKNVYVKLGLVKPKEQLSTEKERLQDQLTEQEIEHEYQYDEFLEQVIDGKEKNLTIVGEAGAGKSTWLEQIALYIDNLNKGFPICISLASLGGKSLEDYLLQIWLEDALPFISPKAFEVTPALENKLKELFNSGKAWLLLDGVDELRSEGYEAPLQTIANQLRGWVDQARVVLTCRSNVWETNPNALLNFETYRTLHFDDEQVGDFIGQWFTQEGKPELGKQLETKLDDTRNDRIRDLIKNTLRLAMLCGIWYFHQGDLPNTKAALYQQYIEYYYQWKPHPQLTDDLDKQEELHTALSKLALEAIDKKLPLRKKFAHKIMGQSLFKLARDVGWLNWVYKDVETGQDVYAFYHPTFQEYFAACAIDEWDYFLPREHKDRPVEDKENPEKYKPYRIFELQWKEVILLWLGRPYEEVAKVQKEEFIGALTEFEDGIKYDFYRFRAYFLAANGIAEFRNCHLAHEIVRLIIDMSFGYFNWEKQRWVRTLEPIAEIAQEVLKETDRARTIPALINLLPLIMDENARQEAASSLGQIDSGNSLAIETLIHLGRNAESELTRKQAFESLRQIAKGNTIAIQAMIQIIQTDSNCYEAYKTLGKIANDSTIPIQSLVQQLNIAKDEALLYIVADTLRQIDSGNSIAIKALTKLVQTAKHEFIRQVSARSLELDDLTRQPVTKNVLRIEKDNLEECEALIEEMVQTEDKLEHNLYAMLLINNLQGNCLRLAVLSLKDFLTEHIYKNDDERFKDFYSVMWHCAQHMPYPDFYQAWHSTTIHQTG